MTITVPQVAHQQNGVSSAASSAKHPDVPNVPAEGVPFFTPAQNPPAGTAFDPQPDGKPIPKLFTPLKIRGLTLQNRIMVSPLCQYSSREGFVSAWNLPHLGGILQRGPALTFVEATAVQSNGRISPEDSGLWLDAHIAAFKPTIEFAHSQSQKIGIQIGHAGRKASTLAPWLTMGPTAQTRTGATATKAVGGWPDDVVSSSAVPYNDAFPSPRAMTLAEIEDLKNDFVAAAKRAVVAGFDVVELHAAHGYLLHQFLSPAVNQRTDRYGGSFENRVRLLLEVADLVRGAIPAEMPLFVRISATDWLDYEGYEGESWTLEQSVELAKLLVEHGVDFLDVSTGGLSPAAKMKFAPGGYQVPFAKAIKKAVGDKLLVSAVGAITEGKQAEGILQGGKDDDDVPIDVVMAGRMFQKNPGLVWTWAEDVGVAIHVAHQMAWPFGGYGGAKKEFK